MSSTPRLDAATRWRTEVQAWEAGGGIGPFPEIDWPDEPEPEPPPPLWLVPRTPPPHEALRLMNFQGRVRRGKQLLTKGLFRAGALTHRPRRDDTNPPSQEESA